MRFTLLPDDQVQRELGKQIDYKRREHQLSIEELAQKSGVSISTINRMIDGSNSPSLLNFIKILRVLGELDRMGLLLEPNDTFRPSESKITAPKKRIFKSKKTTPITWGDE